MTKRFILVAGNIGAGKTSLTERLGTRLGWRTSFESVADNPYLADFYADMVAAQMIVLIQKQDGLHPAIEQNRGRGHAGSAGAKNHGVKMWHS